MHAYHALARAALFVRLRAARRRGADGEGRSIDPSAALKLADDASSRGGARVDATFVQAVLNPPGGRINTVIYERLSVVFDVSSAEIKRALFPGLRGRACA